MTGFIPLRICLPLGLASGVAGLVLLASALIGAQEAIAQDVTLSATGTGIVVPARSWDVSAVAENQIDTIHFIEGQFVKEGDLLVTFDRSFKKWDARIAELDHLHALAQLDLARDALTRKERLSETDTATEVELNEARIAVRIAENTVEALSLKAQKAKALSDLQLIHAPFDGQMSAPRFRDNANVIAESPEIATLYQLDPIHVRVEGTFEKHQERVLAGESPQSVMDSLTLVLQLPGGAEYPHRGRLVSTPYEFDPDTGIGYNIAAFPNPQFLLRPGMKVRVTSYEKAN